MNQSKLLGSSLPAKWPKLDADGNVQQGEDVEIYDSYEGISTGKKIFKEKLRCMKVYGDLPKSNCGKAIKPDMVRLTKEQLHSQQIDFLEDNGIFYCYYSDMYKQL